MSSDMDILQAARKIQPYLPELLIRPEAEQMTQRLNLVLSSAEDAATQSQEIRSILAIAETTQEWLQLYLSGNASPAEILATVRTYHPLPGKAGAIASPRYCCPVASCHQDWYRRHIDDEIPNCPIHGVKMVRASKVPAS